MEIKLHGQEFANQPDHFVDATLIYRSKRNLLYRATRNTTGETVVLKTSNSAAPPAHEVVNLRREFDLLCRCRFKGVAKAIDLESDGQKLFLCMNDAGDRTLKDLVAGNPMTVQEFLPVATEMVNIIYSMHESGILHRDICPANFVLGKKSTSVTLVDFDLATISNDTTLDTSIIRPSRVDTSPLYSAPEQTGRMNRRVDARSDLYSLGATFYEMLTGMPPFSLSDPLEIIHAHLSRTPNPPNKLQPEIPKTLSDLVLKLLAKVPESRYQSAGGLAYDLAYITEHLHDLTETHSFTLGGGDICGLAIPVNLYGRERDKKALSQAFDKMLAENRATCVMVSGYSGVGKTSLVRSLYQPVAQERGFCLAGKFDQLRRDTPFATIGQAFNELIQYLLTENEEQIATWKRKLEHELGPNLGLIARVLPQLELLVGRTQPLPALAADNEKERFKMVFRQFIKVFSRREHPLVLFLDDLQWADLDSLQLIESLVTDADELSLLLIGSYRDNEVSAGHPVTQMIADLTASGSSVRSLTLKPLTLPHVSQMVADTLRCELGEAKPLARLIFQKTRGNPFFTIQFINMLYAEGLLQFDIKQQSWKWDLAQVQAREYADNIVDLLLAKLRRLPATVCRILKIAACIGNTGSLDSLLKLCGCPKATMLEGLAEASRAGLILVKDDRYKFLHDRIQQAAYALIPESERALQHLTLGRILAANTQRDELEESVFAILSQYNLAAELVVEPGERALLAKYNLMAGRKAKHDIAYELAVEFFKTAIAFCTPEKWSTNQDMLFAGHLALAECHWLLHNYEEAEDRLTKLLEHCRNQIESARVYRQLAELYASKFLILESANFGLKGLEMLGVSMPLHPSQDEVFAEYAVVQEALKKRPIESLVDLPLMTNEQMILAMDILQTLYASTMVIDRNLFLLIGCKIVLVSLTYGNCSSSVLGYAQFGSTLPRLYDQFKEAHRLGLLSRSLVEKRGLDEYAARMEFLVGLISFWTSKPKVCWDSMRQAYEIAIKSRDCTFADHCSSHIVVNAFLFGMPQTEVLQLTESFLSKGSHKGITSPLEVIRLVERTSKGLSDDFDFLSPDDIEKDDEYGGRLTEQAPVIAGLYYVLILMVAFIAGDYERAIAAGLKAKPLLWAHVTFAGECEYWYYFALALAAVYEISSDDKKQEYLQTIEQHKDQLKRWSDGSADYFLHKHTLISAELARIKGEDMVAQQLYSVAINQARAAGFIQQEALANELAGKFFLKRKYEIPGRAHLEEARGCYARWGASAKVKQLENMCPGLPRPEVKSWSLDMSTILKAAQAISKEVELDSLLRTLMRVVLEAAGAQSGVLMLQRGSELAVRAFAKSAADDTLPPLYDSKTGQPVTQNNTTLADIPLKDFKGIPGSVINYVKRTHETVVLADASEDEIFSKDEHFYNSGARSVLCLPILKQSKLLGILYLENSLAPRVFTPDATDLLQLLAAEIVTSLENVMLFDALRDSERQFRLMFEMAGVGKAQVDCTTGRFLRVNAKMAAITGYTEEELLSMSFQELTHPEDAQKDLEIFEKLVRGEVFDYELQKRYIRKDGKTIWVQLNVAAISDTFGQPVLTVGVVQDITARLQAEEELKRSEELFRWMVLEVADYSILMLDKRGRVLTWNMGAQRISGYEPEDIVGSHFSRFYACDAPMPCSPDRQLEIAAAVGRFECSSLHQQKCGNMFWASTTLTALYNAAGELKGFTLLIRDLTEQVKSTEERKQLAVLREREDFMAALTHDLKNPLIGGNRILQLFTNGTMGALTPDQQSILGKLQQSNQALIDMLSNLTAIYRMQRDVNSLNIQSVDIVSLLGDVCHDISAIADHANVRLIKNIDTSITEIEADYNFIRRVVQNLLDNALKFTPKGGTVELRLSKRSENILIEVEDTGPGLSEEEKERVFEKFWQGVEGKRYVPGTGLGLNLCKQVVDAHGGTIRCHSQLGLGTCMQVTLPVQQPKTAAITVKSKLTAG